MPDGTQAAAGGDVPTAAKGRIETITVERLRLAAHAQLSRRNLDRTYSVEALVGSAVDNLVLRVERTVLGRTDRLEWTDSRPPVRKAKGTVRVPDGWWEALKERLITATGFDVRYARILRIWGWRIRYRSIRTVVEVHHHHHHVAVTRACPHLEVPAGEGRLVHFRWLAAGEDLAAWGPR